MALVPGSIDRFTLNFNIPIYEYGSPRWGDFIDNSIEFFDAKIWDNLQSINDAKGGSETLQFEIERIEAIAETVAKSYMGGNDFQGGWDASGGTYPALPELGHVYICTVGGDITITVEGDPVIIPHKRGDHITYTGVEWVKTSGGLGAEGTAKVANLTVEDPVDLDVMAAKITALESAPAPSGADYATLQKYA